MRYLHLMSSGGPALTAPPPQLNRAGPRWEASGAWIADHADALQALLDANPAPAALDVARIERIDTFGALALTRLTAAPLIGVAERQAGLIEAVARLPHGKPAA